MLDLPPELDFTSEHFDASKALATNNIYLPYPKAKTYNNLADWYSHTFKSVPTHQASQKAPKNEHFVLKRNYEWYYETLGLDLPENFDIQSRYLKYTKRKRNCDGKYQVDKRAIVREMPPELLKPIRSSKILVKRSDGSLRDLILFEGDTKEERNVKLKDKSCTEVPNSVANEESQLESKKSDSPSKVISSAISSVSHPQSNTNLVNDNLVAPVTSHNIVNKRSDLGVNKCDSNQRELNPNNPQNDVLGICITPSKVQFMMSDNELTKHDCVQKEINSVNPSKKTSISALKPYKIPKRKNYDSTDKCTETIPLLSVKSPDGRNVKCSAESRRCANNVVEETANFPRTLQVQEKRSHSKLEKISTIQNKGSKALKLLNKKPAINLLKCAKKDISAPNCNTGVSAVSVVSLNIKEQKCGDKSSKQNDSRENIKCVDSVKGYSAPSVSTLEVRNQKSDLKIKKGNSTKNEVNSADDVFLSFTPLNKTKEKSILVFDSTKEEKRSDIEFKKCDDKQKEVDCINSCRKNSLTPGKPFKIPKRKTASIQKGLNSIPVLPVKPLNEMNVKPMKKFRKCAESSLTEFANNLSTPVLSVQIQSGIAYLELLKSDTVEKEILSENFDKVSSALPSKAVLLLNNKQNLSLKKCVSKGNGAQNCNNGISITSLSIENERCNDKPSKHYDILKRINSLKGDRVKKKFVDNVEEKIISVEIVNENLVSSCMVQDKQLDSLVKQSDSCVKETVSACPLSSDSISVTSPKRVKQNSDSEFMMQKKQTDTTNSVKDHSGITSKLQDKKSYLKFKKFGNSSVNDKLIRPVVILKQNEQFDFELKETCAQKGNISKLSATRNKEMSYSKCGSNVKEIYPAYENATTPVVKFKGQDKTSDLEYGSDPKLNSRTSVSPLKDQNKRADLSTKKYNIIEKEINDVSLSLTPIQDKENKKEMALLELARKARKRLCVH